MMNCTFTYRFGSSPSAMFRKSRFATKAILKYSSSAPLIKIFEKHHVRVLLELRSSRNARKFILKKLKDSTKCIQKRISFFAIN